MHLKTPKLLTRMQPRVVIQAENIWMASENCHLSSVRRYEGEKINVLSYYVAKIVVRTTATLRGQRKMASKNWGTSKVSFCDIFLYVMKCFNISANLVYVSKFLSDEYWENRKTFRGEYSFTFQEAQSFQRWWMESANSGLTCGSASRGEILSSFQRRD